MNYNPVSRNHRRVNDFTFEIAQGGGCMSVFGLPFFAAGVFILLGVMGFIPVEKSGDLGPWTELVMLLMALPFLGIGGFLLFGRSLMVLDLSSSKIIKEFRFLAWPVHRNEYQLRDYDTVAVRFSAGDSDTADTFPVSLQTRGNMKSLDLDSPADFAVARQLAADVAHFLKISLRDETGTAPVVLTPADASKSLTQRVKEAGLSNSAVPDRPSVMQCRVDDQGGTLSVSTPPPGFLALGFLFALVPLAFLAFFVPGLLEFFISSHTPAVVGYMFIGFLLLAFGLPALLGGIGLLLGARISRQTLQADAHKLTLIERTWRSSRPTVFSVEDIYGLDCITREESLKKIKSSMGSAANATSNWWVRGIERSASAKGITIKSRKGIHTFGAGLPDEELIYLHALIQRRLTGG